MFLIPPGVIFLKTAYAMKDSSWNLTNITLVGGGGGGGGGIFLKTAYAMKDSIIFVTRSSVPILRIIMP